MSKRCSLIVLGSLAVMLGLYNIQEGQGADAPKTAPPTSPAIRPVPGGVRWFMRNHAGNLQATKSKKIDLCFLGDSITQGWPGDLFNKYYGKLNAVNFGIGGDRTENVLWRLERGELKGASPKVIVLLIGTNNAGIGQSTEDIILGVTTVVTTLRTSFPKTKILLLGIFPKSNAGERAKTNAANVALAKLDDKSMVRYLDVGAKFLDADGKVQGGILSDGVHLTRKGYEIWAATMNPLLMEMMEMMEK